MNLTLINNKKIVLEEKISKFNYEKNQFLEFDDEYGHHKIDLNSKIYEKKDKDVIFSIDFVNNLGIIILNGDKRFEFSVLSSYEFSSFGLVLKYKLSEDEIIMKIELKE